MIAEPKQKKMLKFSNDVWCSDFDDDCFDIEDKEKCYAYDPEKGKCHFVCKHPEFNI